MPDPRDVITVERVIPAPPEAIFDLLADPSRHPEIDGSGTVQRAKGGSERLAMGSTFGMAMKLGIPYAMTSTVIEFEADRRIAWQTRGPGSIGRHFGGRVWRYEVEPVDGGTRVRETWDLTTESGMSKPFARKAGPSTGKAMTATLERIEHLVATDR
jgi:uncharacterized protein YndB with AHSA1/START domain